MATKTISQRIALEGGDKIREQLKTFGAQGEKAFKEVQAAADKLKGPGAEFARGIDAALKKVRELGDTIKGVGEKVRGVGVGMSVGVTAPIVALGTKGLSAWKTQEEAVKRLEAALRSTGNTVGLTSEEIQGMASDFQKVTTVGDEATLAMQAVLLTFTQIKGDQFKGATEAILNMSAALGTDLQSTALQVGKALNDPVQGISALKRAGVQLSPVQQQMVRDMVAAGDVAGAQKVILGELTTQFGGMAEQLANTGFGKYQQALNNLGDAWERIGEAIAPVLTKMAEAIDVLTGYINKAVDAFKALPESTQSTIVMFGLIAAAIGPVLAVVGQAVIGIAGLVFVFAKVAGAFAPLIAGFAGTGIAAGGLTAILAGIGAALVSWPAIIAVAGFAITSLGIQIYKNWDRIVEATSAAMDRVRGLVKPLWDELKIDAEGAGETLKGAWRGVAGALATDFKGARLTIGQGLDALAAQFGTSRSEILEALAGIGPALAADFAGAWETIKAGAAALVVDFQGAGQTLRSAWSFVGTELGRDFAGAWETIKAGVAALVVDFQGAGTTIATAWTGAGAALAADFEGAWGTIKAGVAALVVDFQGAGETLRSAWETVSAFIAERFGITFDAARETVVAFFSGIAADAQAGWGKLTDGLAGLADSVKSVFTGIGDFISAQFDRLGDAANRLIDGIKRKAAELLSAIGLAGGGSTGSGSGSGSGIPAYASGGQVSGFGRSVSTRPGHTADGAIRGPGTGTSDSIVSRVRTGGFVLRAAAVRRYGTALLDRFNQRRAEVGESIRSAASSVARASRGSSPSILARLSNGEFFVGPEAVRHYGPRLFEAINRMRLPRAVLSTGRGDPASSGFNERRPARPNVRNTAPKVAGGRIQGRLRLRRRRDYPTFATGGLVEAASNVRKVGDRVSTAIRNIRQTVQNVRNVGGDGSSSIVTGAPSFSSASSSTSRTAGSVSNIFEAVRAAAAPLIAAGRSVKVRLAGGRVRVANFKNRPQDIHGTIPISVGRPSKSLVLNRNVPAGVRDGIRVEFGTGRAVRDAIASSAAMPASIRERTERFRERFESIRGASGSAGKVPSIIRRISESVPGIREIVRSIPATARRVPASVPGVLASLRGAAGEILPPGNIPAQEFSRLFSAAGFREGAGRVRESFARETAGVRSVLTSIRNSRSIGGNVRHGNVGSVNVSGGRSLSTARFSFGGDRVSTSLASLLPAFASGGVVPSAVRRLSGWVNFNLAQPAGDGSVPGAADPVRSATGGTLAGPSETFRGVRVSLPPIAAPGAVGDIPAARHYGSQVSRVLNQFVSSRAAVAGAIPAFASGGLIPGGPAAGSSISVAAPPPARVSLSSLASGGASFGDSVRHYAQAVRNIGGRVSSVVRNVGGSISVFAPRLASAGRAAGLLPVPVPGSRERGAPNRAAASFSFSLPRQDAQNTQNPHFGIPIHLAAPQQSAGKPIKSSIGDFRPFAAPQRGSLGRVRIPAFASGGLVRGGSSMRVSSSHLREVIGRAAPAFASGGLVMRGAAPRLMQAVNALALVGLMPAMSTGGLVSSAPSIAASTGSQSAAAPYAALSLTIGSERFDGLTAPRETADRLVRHALVEEAKSAGRRPGWFRSI